MATLVGREGEEDARGSARRKTFLSVQSNGLKDEPEKDERKRKEGRGSSFLFWPFPISKKEEEEEEEEEEKINAKIGLFCRFEWQHPYPADASAAAAAILFSSTSLPKKKKFYFSANPTDAFPHFLPLFPHFLEGIFPPIRTYPLEEEEEWGGGGFSEWHFKKQECKKRDRQYQFRLVRMLVDFFFLAQNVLASVRHLSSTWRQVPHRSSPGKKICNLPPPKKQEEETSNRICLFSPPP